MDVKLNITADALNELTWEQWEQIENGPTTRQTRDIIAVFVVGEDGKPIPHDEAYALLGKLKGPQIKGVTSVLVDKIKELQAAAVPPLTTSE
jgi:hypothetical protein